MQNRRVAEFFILAMICGLGVPVATLFGVMDGERLAAEAYPNGLPASARAAAPADVDYKAIVMGMPGDEEKGKALFQQNCVACHGPLADGKGAAAAALVPPPRNFTDPKAQWSHGRQPKDIYHTVSTGSPGTAMMGFAAMLSVQDRWAIVHYLGTLGGVKGQFQP